MSRTLVLGRAGTGKTHRVVTELLSLAGAQDAAGRFERFVVLVPTYSEAEHLKRRLLRETGGLPGIFDRGIVTFEQLAERETGVRLRALAPPAVRDALLLDALRSVDAPDLAAAARFAGFRRAALRLVKEVKSSEVVPGEDGVIAAADRLAAAAEGLPGARGAKLRGLALVLGRYQRALAARGLRDHEDLLRELLVSVRENPGRPLRLLALDGFTDLTQVQERIVQVLAEHAERFLVTLLGDPDGNPDGGPDGGPFASTADWARRLRASAGLEVEALHGCRRFGDDLARLERRAAGAPVEPAAPDGSVLFLAGADPADEADRVARRCLRLAAGGVPRSEILVVLRRLDGATGTRVLDALRRHGIPHRAGGTQPVTSVPVAREAVAVLGLLAGRDAETSAAGVVRTLRGGRARGVADREADELDLLVRARAVRTVQHVRELARAASLATCCDWLERFERRRLAPEPTPPHELAARWLDALADLLVLTDGGVVEAGDEERAARDAAALRALEGAVADAARAVTATGRATVTPTELLERVQAASDAATFAPRDRRVDVVNVVDAEEARTWEARAVIVAGLRTGEFPGRTAEDVFVADVDRASVERATGVRLPARAEQGLRRERLLFYSAVTRASETVVLTTHVSGENGEPVLPSPFLEELLEILPADGRTLDGAGRTPGDLRPAPGEGLRRADALRSALTAAGLRYRPGGAGEATAWVGLALLRRLAESDAERVRRAARRHRQPQARLAQDGPASRRMARARTRSASSLGSFAQCAYRHFAAKGLRLEQLPPGPEDGLSPLVAGSIVHRVAERVLTAGVRDEPRALAIFEEEFAEHAGHLEPALATTAQVRAMRSAIAWLVAREAAAGGPFRPFALERPFGMAGEPPLELGPASHPVRVRGQIDRVDTDPAGRAIVVDYKWSSFGRYSGIEQQIEAGLDLQLPLYALAVQRVLELPVAAAGYLTLKDRRERWIRLLADGPGGRRSDVDWTGDTGAAALERVEEQVVALDADIRSGRVEVAPRNPDICRWCDFADLCRVDEMPQ